MSDAPDSCSPVLVEITRGRIIESRHRGTVAARTSRGAAAFSLGPVDEQTFFRSAAKPFQTIPLIASGAAARFELTDEQIAITLASHSGEPRHTQLVSSILDQIGVDESSLLCGSHEPFDPETNSTLRAARLAPTPLHNNCSGKHAGMLALAKHLGLPLSDYISPNHPIQQMIRSTIARFAGCSADAIEIAIDGCSAPVFGLTLDQMALSYAHLVHPALLDCPASDRLAATRVVEAMTSWPQLIGGRFHRLDTDLMAVACGRIISKVGAEGVHLLGVVPCDQFPAGLGIAIKIEDGDTRRARDPVVIEILKALGLLDANQLQELSRYGGGQLTNHRGLSIGEIRTTFKLS